MTDAKADIWMPLFIGDYLAGTSRLTTEQHGAYLLLIMDYWKNGALPDNDQILAQIARLAPDAWSMHRAVLEQFFTVSNGQWVHARIEKELDAARSKKAKAKEKAEAAARARWEKERAATESKEECSEHATSTAPSAACAMHEECPSPSPSPLPSKTQSTSTSKDGSARKRASSAQKLTAADLTNEFGVEPDHAAAWLEVRKAKRAPLTRVAMNDLITEFRKAGLSTPDGVALCARKSWQGFKASWDWQGGGSPNRGGRQPTETPRERAIRMAREQGIPYDPQ